MKFDELSEEEKESFRKSDNKYCPLLKQRCIGEACQWFGNVLEYCYMGYIGTIYDDLQDLLSRDILNIGVKE